MKLFDFPFWTFLFCCYCQNTALATGNNERYLLHTDTLQTSLNTESRAFLYHSIAQGQTMYSLAKFYGVSLNEINTLNPGLAAHWKLGTLVKVPLQKIAMRPHTNGDFVRWKFAPLYHKVLPGETLYRISTTFGMAIDTLKARNQIPATGLAPGKLIHVGWYSTAGMPDEAPKLTAPVDKHIDHLRQQNLSYRGLFDAKDVKKMKAVKGPALWNKSTAADLFVLHNQAAIGSVVRLYNPQARRFLYAKVLGRIPAGAIDPSILVVLSEPVGKYLGAVDGKVFLEIKYYP